MGVCQEGVIPVSNGKGCTFNDFVCGKVRRSQQPLAILHILGNDFCQVPVIKALAMILRQLRKKICDCRICYMITLLGAGAVNCIKFPACRGMGHDGF